MINIYLEKPVIKVVSEKEVEVYYKRPIPIYNFTSIANPLDATTTSGVVYLSTYPKEGGIFNKHLGSIVALNTATSGVEIITTINLETNLRRAGIPISGSKLLGG